MESFERFLLIESSDEASFARQFLSRLEDSLTMLVFADWLDDQGESYLATNIRNAVENATSRKYNLPVEPVVFFRKEHESGPECGTFLFSINDSYYASWPDWKVFSVRQQENHTMLEPGNTLFAVNKKDPTKWVTYTNHSGQFGRFATPRDRRPEIETRTNFPGTFGIKIKDCQPISLMQVPDCIVIKMMWGILGRWTAPAWGFKGWGGRSVIGKL